jgi:hypothetical protein
MRGRVRLAFILLVAVALRLFFFTGLILYDDAHYVGRAFELSLGHLTPPIDHWEARLGLVGPTALAFRFFGFTRPAMVAFPFLCSLASVIAAWAFGRRLLDERAGLLAALLLAFFPLDVLGATLLFTNTAQTLLVGAAVGFFLVAERSRASSPGTYALAGASLGLSLLVHESSALALVFVPFYWLAIARPAWRHAWILAGFLPALTIDPLVHGLMGDPAARLHAIDSVKTVHAGADDVRYQGFNVEWIFEPIWRSLTEQELGLYPLLIGPLAFWLLFRPRLPVERALALFLVVVGLWIFYGTVTPFAYAPLMRVPRYLAPLVLPAMWLLGSELARRSRTTRWLVLAALAVSSVICVAVDGGRARMPRFERVHAALVAEGARRVVAPESFLYGLRVAAAYRPPYELAALESTPDPRDALVVVDDPATLAQLGGAETRAELVFPPTFYERLLATPPVMALLRHTRNQDRLVDLLEKRARANRVVILRVR